MPRLEMGDALYFCSFLRMRYPAGRRSISICGSSPNSLVEFFMKACQGPGRKGRLRSKHRPEIRFPWTPFWSSAKRSGGGIS